MKRQMIMKVLKISIIVAVYNIGEYISRCVDSLASCKLPDAEIILVDDGSTDDSGSICDEYAKDIAYVTTCHKPNGGLSDARNHGLERASGEWIIFMDGDDCVKSAKLQEFASMLGSMSADVVFNDCIIDNLKTKRETETRQTVGVATLEGMLSKPGAMWNVWRYAYRREFLLRNSLNFKVGFLAEDMDFTARILSMPDLRIDFLHLPYYVYSYHRGGSIMEQPSLRFIASMTEIAQAHYRQLLHRKDKVAKQLRRKLLRDHVYQYAKVRHFGGNELKAFKMLYRESSMPFNSMIFKIVGALICLTKYQYTARCYINPLNAISSRLRSRHSMISRR
jgi:glycosyltransferase involved in cell wall biosynthesis